MIKAIIFDIGGVIVSPEVDNITPKVLSLFGIKSSISKKLITKYNSDLTKGKITLFDFYLRVIKSQNLKETTPEKILNIHLKLIKKIISPLNNDIVKLIKKLRRNYLVICLSNTEIESVNLVRNKGIYNLFNKVFLSTNLHMQKPDKEIYLSVLKQMKLKPDQVIFIDDKKENTLAAKKLGINALQYKWNDALEQKINIFLHKPV